MTSYVLLLLLLPPVADAFTAPVVRPPDLGIPEAGKGATLLNVRVAQTPAWYAGQAYLLSLDEVAFPAGAAFEVVRHPAADEEDAAARAPEGSVPVFYPAGAAGHEASRAFGTQHVILQGAEAPSPHARELAPGWWSIRFESAWSALREARRLADEADAHDAQQVILPPRVLHHVPNDPYFSQQWHLRNTGQRGATAGIDANLPAAWETVRGSGINISVVDDGTEYTHPDLAPAYRGGSGSWDHCDNDPDPAPVGDESHGTAVTGVAAARGDNGIGVSGAAPAASFSAHRFLCAGSGDPAAALGAGTNDIHISTNSWGYSGTGLVPLSGATAAALANNILNGRDGKGQIYLFAAGNSRSEGHDANYQGLTASRYVITVGAIGADGHVSHYSSPCACLLLGAPSNSAGLPGIATTDRTGAAGYNDGGEFDDASYTTGFGGTSSATPLVAGVVALLLEANPDLTWREVQGVLAASARRSGLGPTTWTTNAAGYATSRDFGFGMVDAGSAVRRAQTWIPWTPELATSATNSTRLPIPDAGPEVTASLDLPLDLRIERVVLTLSAEHPWRGDLRVELESPAGTRSRVIPGRATDGGHDFHAWQASSTQFFGERSAGRWKLHVRDLAALDVGAVTSFSITAYGRAVDVAPPVVVDATVSASRLDLEFDEPIDAYFLPAASAFSISRDGSPESPSAVSIAGPRVSLALSTPVTDTQVLAVTYAPPGTDFLRDAQGNAVPGFASLPVENVNPDVTPPTVELTTVPIAPDGGDGWFVSAATASLSATDATSPVSSVLYCISPSDDCAPNVPYVGPIALPEGPTRYLRYQATDAASNPSPVGSYAFKVDLRPPAVFANFTPGPSPSGWWLTQPTAVLEASDATSGVEALLYCVDTEGACAPTTPYSAAILLEAPLRRLRYTAADAAGNVAPAATVDVRADITPPTLTASVSPAAPDAGEWYTTRPVLSVSASDPESGIASVRYCTDVDDTCDPTAEVDGEIAVPDGSPRYVRIRATNGAGNSSAVLSVALKVDVEAPALSFQTDPAAPDGAASWFITAPTVAIHAVDAGQGVADLRYCVDTSDTCDPLADGQEYLAPISLGMGITYVRARAVDELGRANVLSSAFRVDLEDPLASLEISPAVGDGPDGWWTAPPAFAWTTSDVGSGVAGRFYCVDPTGACVPDLVWPEGDAAPPLPEGLFVLRYRVLDAAGRASVPGSLPLKLDTLPPAFVAHVTPATPDGIGGWYNQDVTLVLEAVDSGSGILAGSVETSADGGASWQAVAGASASFELTEGVTTLRLRATDNVGRAATSDDHVVRIDLTPPTVSATPAVSGSAASVTFAFSEPMDVASTSAALLAPSGSTLAWSDAHRVLTVSHGGLGAGTHTFRLSSDARDAHGVPLAQWTWLNVTIAPPPPPPPPAPPIVPPPAPPASAPAGPSGATAADEPPAGPARFDAQIEQDPSTSRIVARFTEEAAWLREVEIGEQAPIARVVYVPLDERPVDLPAPPGRPLLLFEARVERDDAAPATTLRALLRACVPRDAIAGADVRHLVVQHHVAGSWTPLPTRLVEERATCYLIEAETDGFSPFAIVVDEDEPELEVAVQKGRLVGRWRDGTSGVDPASLRIEVDGAPLEGASRSEDGFEVLLPSSLPPGERVLTVSVADRTGRTAHARLVHDVPAPEETPRPIPLSPEPSAGADAPPTATPPSQPRQPTRSVPPPEETKPTRIPAFASGVLGAFALAALLAGRRRSR